MSGKSKTHRHKADHEETRSYTGGVAVKSVQVEPRAAGGICMVEFCACGAKRRTNRNQGYRETSGWVTV